MELVKYLTEAVATELDAPLSEVYSSSRKKEAVWTRHIMWLIYEGIATQKERGAFYPINGKPRDHATVWHGVINIQNVFLTMPHLKEIYTRYKEIADEKFAEERERRIAFNLNAIQRLFTSDQETLPSDIMVEAYNNNTPLQAVVDKLLKDGIK